MDELEICNFEIYEELLRNLVNPNKFYGKRSFAIYKSSLRCKNNVVFLIFKIESELKLAVISSIKIPEGFIGLIYNIDGYSIQICSRTSENLDNLRKNFSNLSPSVIGKTESTFGTGDRLGIATPGHISAFSESSFIPVLAQQSMRELELTNRTYKDVIEEAAWGVFTSGYKGAWSADGDHLKSIDDIRIALKQGCTMITADLSDKINYQANELGRDRLGAYFNSLKKDYKQYLYQNYTPILKITDNLTLYYDNETLHRIALTYFKAIDYAVEIFQTAMKEVDNLDFEVSIDEISIPTSPEAHFFVANELIQRGVALTSLAPRYIGEFQKGIDYIGNAIDFEENFCSHALIADTLGYKLSIHSSSDKFQVYPIIARNQKGPVHLKTSGTSWLEALEMIAKIDPTFFRLIFKYACEIFETARAYYHVTPDMNLLSYIDSIPDEGLSSIFKNNTNRQVLHISYGELFKRPEIKKKIFNILTEDIDKYWDSLNIHMKRHLTLLNP